MVDRGRGKATIVLIANANCNICNIAISLGQISRAKLKRREIANLF